jgi:hypothetical protein
MLKKLKIILNYLKNIPLLTTSKLLLLEELHNLIQPELKSTEYLVWVGEPILKHYLYNKSFLFEILSLLFFWGMGGMMIVA